MKTTQAPGSDLPQGRIKDIISELPDNVGRALEAHIRGATSSTWLSETLTSCGYPVAARTIREYRGKIPGRTK